MGVGVSYERGTLVMNVHVDTIPIFFLSKFSALRAEAQPSKQKSILRDAIKDLGLHLLSAAGWPDCLIIAMAVL